MKALITTLTLFYVLFIAVNTSSAITFNGREYEYIEGQWYEVDAGVNFELVGTQIIVKFTDTATQEDIDNLNSALGGEIVMVDRIGMHLIKSNQYPEPDPLDFCDSYLQQSLVLKAHNNTVVILCQPNDACYEA